jgi:uncharacterized protein YuzE
MSESNNGLHLPLYVPTGGKASPYITKTVEVNATVLIDLDEDGIPIGVEILGEKPSAHTEWAVFCESSNLSSIGKTYRHRGDAIAELNYYRRNWSREAHWLIQRQVTGWSKETGD